MALAKTNTHETSLSGWTGCWGAQLTNSGKAPRPMTHSHRRPCEIPVVDGDLKERIPSQVNAVSQGWARLFAEVLEECLVFLCRGKNGASLSEDGYWGFLKHSALRVPARMNNFQLHSCKSHTSTRVYEKADCSWSGRIQDLQIFAFALHFYPFTVTLNVVVLPQDELVHVLTDATAAIKLWGSF